MKVPQEAGTRWTCGQGAQGLSEGPTEGGQTPRDFAEPPITRWSQRPLPFGFELGHVAGFGLWTLAVVWDIPTAALCLCPDRGAGPGQRPSVE